MESGCRRFTATALLLAAALLLVASLCAAPAPAKGGKLRACVTKKGPDKGAMRFVRGGKCHKGEKKVTWRKKGKPGPAGPAGPQGPSGLTDQLLETITQQQQTIETLTTQVATITSQLDALTEQLGGLSPRVAALCGQMSTVTSRANALRAAIGGLDLNAVLTTLGGAIVFPALPAALTPFSCPAP